MESLKRNNLSKIPYDVLYSFLEKFEENPSSSMIKEDLIQQILVEIEKESEPDQYISQLDDLFTRYRDAGKGSLSWSYPKLFQESKDEIVEIILSKFTVNPFYEEIKPEISYSPQLNKISWFDKNNTKLKLEFVLYRRPIRFELGLNDFKDIKPIKHVTAFIRFLGSSKYVVESRSNQNLAKKIHHHVWCILDKYYEIISFSEEEIHELKNELEAKKKGARIKKASGDYDTITVKAAPNVDDLDESEEYQDDFAGDELKKGSYSYSSDEKEIVVNVSRSRSIGTIWFLSDIQEGVIDHVFQKVINVKKI